jgi:hypothetical protein
MSIKSLPTMVTGRLKEKAGDNKCPCLAFKIIVLSSLIVINHTHSPRTTVLYSI